MGVGVGWERSNYKEWTEKCEADELFLIWASNLFHLLDLIHTLSYFDRPLETEESRGSAALWRLRFVCVWKPFTQINARFSS